MTQLAKKLTLSDLINQIAEHFVQADLYYGHGTANAQDEAAWAVHHVLDLPFNLDDAAYAELSVQKIMS